MSKIEDRLWSELERNHATELALGSPTQLPTQRRVRRAPFAIGGLGLAGAIVAAAVALTATSGSPAFALARNSDGSVTLTINQLAGVTGANEELAKLGIRARVARYEAGCVATGNRIAPTPGTPYPAQERTIVQPLVSGGVDAWRINPNAIPAGDTLSLIASKEPALNGATVEGFSAALYQGPAPACFPLPQ